MFKIIALLFVVISLNACTEMHLVSHLAKKIPMPGDIPKGKGIFKIGNSYVIKGRTYYPKESYGLTETGIASWYGPGFHGKLTANGEVYNQYELTAAHRTLQMPSIVRVTNLENGRSLIMRVNDRGPYSRNRILDVSDRGAELLGFKKQGTAKIKLEVLSEESHIVADLAKKGLDTSGIEVAFNNKRYPINDIKKQDLGVTSLNVDKADLAILDKEVLPTLGQMHGSSVSEKDLVKVAIKPSNIFVQAGSFKVQKNALSLASSLSSLTDSRVYPAFIKDVQFYRVRLGPFSDVSGADAVLNKLVDSGNAEAMIIIEEM